MHKYYYMQRRFFFLSILAAASLFAKKAPLEDFVDQSAPDHVAAPWLTGPLLAPSSIALPPGAFNTEPTFYIAAQTGNYNDQWEAVKKPTFWNSVFQPSFQFGLVRGLDFQFLPTLVYNYVEGAAKWGLGDTPIILDIQIYKSHGKATDWITALKLSLKELIPTGQYQNLDPKKLGTDAIGGGSWQTGIALTWGNLIYFGGAHFMAIRSAFEYGIPAPVHVKNLNTYGGGAGTRGKVYPAQNFTIDIGMEFTLTQNWALAMDLVSQWVGETRFEGKSDFPNSSLSGWQFSLAPAIEYNWSANLGMILGPWFTVGGRNTGQFATAIFAINYYR